MWHYSASAHFILTCLTVVALMVLLGKIIVFKGMSFETPVIAKWTANGNESKVSKIRQKGSVRVSTRNRSGTPEITGYYRPWNRSVSLPKRLSTFALGFKQNEYNTALNLMKAMRRALTTHDIPYMLSYGTLLGSYRHHGFIPWDDDIDVLVNSSDRSRIKMALDRIRGAGLTKHRDNLWKLYKESSKSDSHKHSFNWPYIDIFFFTENKTYLTICPVFHVKNTFKKSDVFPLKQGVFEGLTFKVPCNPKAVLAEAFGQSVTQDCESDPYSHKDQGSKEEDGIRKVPCKDLFSYFPFVQRKIDKSGRVIESLKVGKTIIHESQDTGICRG